jgi:hypothetical protein
VKHLIIVLTIVILFFRSITLAGSNENKVMPDTNTSGEIDLFSFFPKYKFTPNGYLANPYHTAALNRSGVLRSVPPLGFGFWARPLPWPYGGAGFGFGLTRHRNYLSLLKLSINIDGKMFYCTEDFEQQGVELYSRYHTQNMMSYDFEIDDLIFRAMYFQVEEHSLVCILEIENRSEINREITVHATNVYGDIYKGYWGCDGIVSLYNEEKDVAVSKFYADGDMFVLGSDKKSISYKATTIDSEWNTWMDNNDLTDKSASPTSLRIKKKTTEEGKTLGHMLSVLSYQYSLDPFQKDTMKIGISRGLNEKSTIKRHDEALTNARSTLIEKIQNDREFYANTPVLTGDWPEAWKHGFIYHIETIRMNIHPPIGIYKHYWDGMQVHTPRVVLGESAIDGMCLSYADIELAKDVILGTFADATDDNIPCSREDGSLNLVCGNGKETGTAPIWGLPFHVIHSIYLRDRDDAWIENLYPHMKKYIAWWLANRTDDEGWFHCACSWESGQDGSKRFRVGDVAASAEDVRTVDIEAAMANAITNMIFFAEVARKTEDIQYWKKMSDLRIQRTRDMFVDGRFRDFDAKTGEPIILDNYYSVMMLSPISFGIASREQMEQSAEIFQYFKENYRFWLEWPSFMFPFSEAAWNAGQRQLLSDILVNSGNGIFPGTDSRKPLYVEPKDAPGLSKQFSYRLPGVAAEWWPYKRGDMWAGGCENYGWGATFPTLLLRNLIGFREISNLKEMSFNLTPSLSNLMFKEGKTYGVRNLNYCGIKIDIDYTIEIKGKIRVQINCHADDPIGLIVKDENLKIIDSSEISSTDTSMSFSGKNFGLYKIQILKN